MKLQSNAFQEGASMPTKYTCDGSDISPPLTWSDAPSDTKSFALIVDDPDAPGKTFVHWVLFNIPNDVTTLEENQPKQDRLPNGAIHGSNDFGTNGYGGPCPPGGTHRYYFKLYALDTELSLKPGTTKQKLLKTMEGYILDQKQCMGTYSR